MKLNWYLFGQTHRTKTVGPYLAVDLPQLGIEQLSAKIDTGAFSGALHASGIKEVTGEQGKQLLQFTPHGNNQKVIQVDTYHKRKVKSSNGETSLRFAFETEIVILEETYLITITLSNRSSMKYPMLIGRKFLRTHGFLVDVSMLNK